MTYYDISSCPTCRPSVDTPSVIIGSDCLPSSCRKNHVWPWPAPGNGGTGAATAERFFSPIYFPRIIADQKNVHSRFEKLRRDCRVSAEKQTSPVCSPKKSSYRHRIQEVGTDSKGTRSIETGNFEILKTNGACYTESCWSDAFDRHSANPTQKIVRELSA